MAFKTFTGLSIASCAAFLLSGSPALAGKTTDQAGDGKGIFADYVDVRSMPFGIALEGNENAIAVLGEVLNVYPRHVAYILRYEVGTEESTPQVRSSMLGMGAGASNAEPVEIIRTHLLAGDFEAALAAFESNPAPTEPMSIKDAVMIEIIAGEGEQSPRMVIGTWFEVSDLMTRNKNPDIQTTVYLSQTEATGRFEIKSAETAGLVPTNRES